MPTRAARFFTLPEYPLATIPQKKRELVSRALRVLSESFRVIPMEAHARRAIDRRPAAVTA